MHSDCCLGAVPVPGVLWPDACPECQPVLEGQQFVTRDSGRQLKENYHQSSQRLWYVFLIYAVNGKHCPCCADYIIVHTITINLRHLK